MILVPPPQSRISRIQAFEDQGVSLAYPARSWSGVREDGAVVIAIRAGEVQSSFDGFRCLLWSPVIEGATEWVDRPIKQERLGHCRMAASLGGADGFLVSGSAAEVERNEVFGLRVEKRNGEYWAFWGSSTVSGRAGRIERKGAFILYDAERLAA